MSQMPGQFPPAGGGGMAPPPKKSNTLLWVVLGIGGFLLCGCGGCIAMVAIPAMMFGPPAIAATMESQAAMTNPLVVEKIGQVTAPPRQVPGGEQMEMGKLMQMTWELSGSKGTATHTVRVEKQGDSWNVTSSRVKFQDGSEIDLKNPAVTNEVMPVDPAGGDADSTETDSAEGDESENN